MTKYAKIKCDYFNEEVDKWYVYAWFINIFDKFHIYENEEGTVIAKIDEVTRTVEYLDQAAKYDEYAQSVIKKKLKELEEKAMKENNNTKQKLRVWWMPQIPCESFYIPVDSPEEGIKILDILAVYDMFQLQENIKPDFCNAGGLQYYDEESGDWEDWYLETENDYYDNVDDYFDSDECKDKEKLEDFRYELFRQIN